MNISSKIGNIVRHAWAGYGPQYFKEARNYRRCSEYLPGNLVHHLIDGGIIQVPNFPEQLTRNMASVEGIKKIGLLIENEINPAPGVANRMLISLKSDILQKYLSDKVAPYFQGYLGKRYVIRGNPRVVYNQASNRQPADRFHMDYGFHQLTLQVLLNDVFEDMTHMEYLEGTNSSSWFSPSASLLTSRKPDRFMPDRMRKKLIGKAGTAFLFDAGNGYHRAKVSSLKGSGRKVFSINFTAATHLDLLIDHYENLSGGITSKLNHAEIFESFKV